MSNEDGVLPLNCISVSLPYKLAPIQKPNLAIPSITPKFVSPLLLGREGEHDNLISLWEKVLYWTLHESILQPLIFISHEQDAFLFPSVVVVNIAAPASHIFGDIRV